MSELMSDVLPALYRRLLPERFLDQVVSESRATCSECAMCEHAGAPRPSGIVTFRPDTKCCTFHPKLPNYLIGAALADPELGEGHRRLRQRISERVGVTPRWIAPPAKYSVLLEAGRGAGFGRTAALRCPYYQPDGGLCTVWKTRESDCSTFFCKYENGADGRAFWHAVGRYLGRLEAALAEFAAHAVDPALEEPSAPRGTLTVEDLEDRPPPERDYEKWWGAWVGREAEFYEQTHARVCDLSADDLQRVIRSDEHEARLATVLECDQAARSADLPPALVRASDLAPRAGPPGTTVVVGYSKYDPVVLPNAAYGALDEFRADRSVAESQAAAKNDRDVQLDDASVRLLHRLRVLVPPTNKT